MKQANELVAFIRSRSVALTQRGSSLSGFVALAHWERNPVALRPDHVLSRAQALNVSVGDLVGTNGSKKRGSSATGKMKQLFEAASRFPRSQQQKLVAIIEPFIEHHEAR